MIEELELTNNFYCPAGRWPFRGWLLLPKYEYDQLDKYSTTLQLNIDNTNLPDNVGTLKKLSIVQAQCVTRGISSDPNSLYLIEITDGRGILWNEWFQFPTNSLYNIRAPAYPQTDRGGTFYVNTMNTGVSPNTTWTWSTMIQDLWNQMSTFLGTYPGLPYTPNGTPEGVYYPGVSAWPALCDILEYLGMDIAANLTSSTTQYTIVRKGITDTNLTTLQTQYQHALEEDLEWIDYGAGRVPANVMVLFRRRQDVYGSEETVRRDSLQYITPSVYSVTMSAPSEYTGGVGTHYIWSEFTVRYNQDGTINTADANFASSLARQRANQYYDSIHPFARMSQTYAGALPFTTGSEVDGVRWWMGNNMGWRTQIVHGPNPPWPKIWDCWK